jgi:hypothetical protein
MSALGIIHHIFVVAAMAPGFAIGRAEGGPLRRDEDPFVFLGTHHEFLRAGFQDLFGGKVEGIS